MESHLAAQPFRQMALVCLLFPPRCSGFVRGDERVTQPERKELPIYSSPLSSPDAPLDPFMRIDGELWKLVGQKDSLGIFEKVEREETGD